MPARAPPGEFALIDRFVRAVPVRGAGVLVGPGDDAAVLRIPPGEELVATVDAVVAGVHFDPRGSPADAGWKALAVNLSDLAAMGARPLFALVALGLAEGTPEATVRGIAGGLGACARAHGVAVVGGNVTRARDLSITVTALGAVPQGRAVLRAGARPGDLVAVTGTVGDAALGLAPRRGPGPRPPPAPADAPGRGGARPRRARPRRGRRVGRARAGSRPPLPGVGRRGPDRPRGPPALARVPARLPASRGPLGAGARGRRGLRARRRRRAGLLARRARGGGPGADAPHGDRAVRPRQGRPGGWHTRGAGVGAGGTRPPASR